MKSISALYGPSILDMATTGPMHGTVRADETLPVDSGFASSYQTFEAQPLDPAMPVEQNSNIRLSIINPQPVLVENGLLVGQSERNSRIHPEGGPTLNPGIKEIHPEGGPTLTGDVKHPRIQPEGGPTPNPGYHEQADGPQGGHIQDHGQNDSSSNTNSGDGSGIYAAPPDYLFPIAIGELDPTLPGDVKPYPGGDPLTSYINLGFTMSVGPDGTITCGADAEAGRGIHGCFPVIDDIVTGLDGAKTGLQAAIHDFVKDRGPIVLETSANHAPDQLNHFALDTPQVEIQPAHEVF